MRCPDRTGLDVPELRFSECFRVAGVTSGFVTMFSVWCTLLEWWMELLRRFPFPFFFLAVHFGVGGVGYFLCRPPLVCWQCWGLPFVGRSVELLVIECVGFLACEKRGGATSYAVFVWSVLVVG